MTVTFMGNNKTAKRPRFAEKRCYESWVAQISFMSIDINMIPPPTSTGRAISLQRLDKVEISQAFPASR
jgi:hypothetical protein